MLVTLNGVDETGKTTVINGLLRYNKSKIQITPRITNFDARWGIIEKDFYFDKNNVPKFMDIMSKSITLLADYVSHLPDNSIYILDRGLMTIIASFKGFLRLKTNLSAKDVNDYLLEYCTKQNMNLEYPKESASILLRPYKNHDKNVNFTIGRILQQEPNKPKSFIEVYSKYQKFFNEELEKYNDRFTHVIDCKKSVENVRNLAVQAINSRHQIKVR
ncbi:MAG: hypothetical protein LBH92_01455 [Bacteroidales bacterium]|jgi:thymidylate kinase|nr:hypothetical protein [Bacteroidales bacterium]